MLYPIGIQEFESLRKGGFVYIDKTALIYRLANTGKYYFLSRPRRFGKSLLVSTLEAYLTGKRDLFDGLEIQSLEKDWTVFPVLHLDFSGVSYTSADVLEQKLDSCLVQWEDKFEIQNKYTVNSIRFSNIIDAAFSKTGKPVAILIDEYDKPIIDNLDNPSLQEHFRSVLQGFYSVMKAKDGKIRLGFLTGVTKIGKLSVFSGLNNLNDISMDAVYNDICGISEDELHRYFTGSVSELAIANGMDAKECFSKLKEMYDGYHFCENTEGIYNPFSLLSTLAGKKFREYWFETGTPSFLVKIMKDTSFDITGLSCEEADSSLMSSVNTVFENPIPLLYQAGYLTIKEYDDEFGLYRLGFPNMEVKKGFLNFRLHIYHGAQG